MINSQITEEARRIYRLSINGPEYLNVAVAHEDEFVAAIVELVERAQREAQTDWSLMRDSADSLLTHYLSGGDKDYVIEQLFGAEEVPANKGGA